MVRHPAGSGLNQRIYYLANANFNVTALAGAEGSIYQRYVYDAYGNCPDTGGVGVGAMDPNWDPRSPVLENYFLFAGYWRDAKTGLYHARNRYHHIGYRILVKGGSRKGQPHPAGPSELA